MLAYIPYMDPMGYLDVTFFTIYNYLCWRNTGNQIAGCGKSMEIPSSPSSTWAIDLARHVSWLIHRGLILRTMQFLGDFHQNLDESLTISSHSCPYLFVVQPWFFFGLRFYRAWTVQFASVHLLHFFRAGALSGIRGRKIIVISWHREPTQWWGSVVSPCFFLNHPIAIWSDHMLLLCIPTLFSNLFS